MASRRVALRKARKKLQVEPSARGRNCTAFEKMMVQEISENMSRKPITAKGTGSELLTSSQKFTSSNPVQKAAQMSQYQPAPFFFRLHLYCSRRTQKTEIDIKCFWPPAPAQPVAIIVSNAGRAGGRKLRGDRKGPRAVSSGPESADGRDRQRQVDRGGRAGAAARSAKPRLKSCAPARERARISGIFEIAPTPALAKLLEDAGVELEDNELLVEREILANGKSRAWSAIVPRPRRCCENSLRTSAIFMASTISSSFFLQRCSARCWTRSRRRERLTQTAATIFERWRAASAELEELDRAAQEKLRLADLWASSERRSKPSPRAPGEDAELENERRVLRNVVKLEESASAAYAALYEAPESAAAQLRDRSRKRLEELARIDESARKCSRPCSRPRLRWMKPRTPCGIISRSWKPIPAGWIEVESRLAALEKLKRKYGATDGRGAGVSRGSAAASLPR